MSDMFTPEAQFSIYKISFDDVESNISNKKNKDDPEYISAIVTELINSITYVISQKLNSTLYHTHFEGFSGLIFKTIHEPVWKTVAQQMIVDNKHGVIQPEVTQDFLTNSNISYILFYECNKTLYAMTGGYGSIYIKKYIVKNYGLYLLPKIVNRDNPVLKQIIENNLTGNQASTHRANRKNTNFVIEQDMSSIFRQLNVEVNQEAAQELGISFKEDEPKAKKINIVNKDSIVIRRSFSLNELAVIIRKLYTLEKRRDRFPLNYLVQASKRNLKSSTLLEILVEDIQNGKLDNFILVGDEYEDYCVNADEYFVFTANGDTFIQSVEPVTMEILFNKIQEKGIKLTKTFMRTMLKHWTISTADNSGNTVLFPVRIIDAIQGHIEYGASNLLCYLFNGNWYVFDPMYEKSLATEYKELYDQKEPISDTLKAKFQLQQNASTEDAYNHVLYANAQIVVAHTVLMHFIELADAIFWDDSTIYLMHNKMNFNGSGSRDLANQILTASEYLQMKMASIERRSFLSEYYKAIHDKYVTNGKSVFSKKTEFIRAFETKKICFIAGYLKGFKKNSKSTYSKYLSIDINKKLSVRGYNWIPMSIQD